ncbi:hypothetical protein MTO96_024198 [Rhipicephalus appendiculatus]
MTSSYLRGIQAEIPSVDLTQLADRMERISLKFKASGADLDEPCGRAADSRCWITWHLAALNEAMRDASMRIVEHAPGVFTLNSVPTANPNYKNTENTFLESVTLVNLLLNRCVTRLDVGDSAVLFCYFPTLLSKALLQASGLRVHVSDVRAIWRETHSLAALSSALAELSLRLRVLDFNNMIPTAESVEAISDALRRGSLCHLVMSNVTRTAWRLFRAVGHSSCLRELQIEGTSRRPILNAVNMAIALERNKALRKLTVKWLEKEAIRAIFMSLKNNATLEELALYNSYDPPNRFFWEGLEELRMNRGLKCLKLVDLTLADPCALIIAAVLLDVLREVCLPRNEITDRGAGSLAKCLQHNSTLKRLDISGCPLSYDALSDLVASLALNTTVECVRLGTVHVPETWTPSSALTANVCGRLDVAWNTRGLQDWAASLRQGHQLPRLRVVCAIASAKPTGVVQWFDAARASGVALTELVFRCPVMVAQECGEAVTSFLRDTNSLKRLTVELTYRGVDDGSCGHMTSFIRGLARNTSVSEAKFCQSVRANEVKALQEMMLTNRTLHRLEFKGLYRNERVVRSMESALEDNFVLLSIDLEHTPRFSMHPILAILNRNRSLLNRAVDCILYNSSGEECKRALRLLSATDSLLDAVADVSGKGREECKNLSRPPIEGSMCAAWGNALKPGWRLT